MIVVDLRHVGMTAWLSEVLKISVRPCGDGLGDCHIINSVHNRGSNRGSKIECVTSFYYPKNPVDTPGIAFQASARVSRG